MLWTRKYGKVDSMHDASPTPTHHYDGHYPFRLEILSICDGDYHVARRSLW